MPTPSRWPVFSLGCKMFTVMKIENQLMVFNTEEKFFSGLPDALSLSCVKFAFRWVRDARNKCYGEFCTLLTCDMDLLTEKDMARLPSYGPRIQFLDDMSYEIGMLTDNIFRPETRLPA